MYCNQCGNEIKDGENFCPECGNSTKTKVEPTIKNVSSEVEDNYSNIGFILGIISCVAWYIAIVGLIVSIIGLIFSVKENKKPRNSNSKLTQAEISMILNTSGLMISAINSFIGALIGSGVL